MKKTILSIALMLCAAFAFAQHTKKDLIGKWAGVEDANQKGFMIFKTTSQMAMYTQGDDPRYFAYTVDFSKTPAPLDILAKSPAGKEVTLPLLIQFIDNNTIKIQVFDSGNRTANFNKKLKKSISILKRVKK